MQSVTRSNLREETFVCNFEKASSIIFILFLNITILRSLPEAPLLHRGSLHTSSFSPHPSIHNRFLSQTARACESFALPLKVATALQLLVVHFASQLWFPLHSLRSIVLGCWARGQGGALTFVPQGGVCWNTILK